ncbi:DUF1254 domain-containing protein [Rhizobium ruizarguesonis]|uniref:DUF1254 domain-containing protein n=1 Tax=Rhizobium ruizarguesonis TaxID=2081791 RepID=UPI0013C14342|nr:DUF1254 domain-containing protein [Rhizobium ruizarguesonis]NEI96439.1 DUF1254 domain-containing protein [Rhizobium ruizarguesonis]NEJ33938.1 DUF1254 domain-containing protein [Rhizobium ruizarguesonis]
MNILTSARIAVLPLALAVAMGTPVKAQEPSVAEAKAIAQEAFVFGLPLVYIATQADELSHVTKPEAGRAPFNQFAHYRQFPDARNNPIVGMNVDTLYSIAYLDLSKEPIVLSIPEVGDRFWLMQIIDAWNDVPAAPGSRTYGPKGGDFALVGPNWNGKLPEGLIEIRSDTSLTMIGGRTYTSGKDEYDVVHKLQDQYKLVPLSKWGSDYTPPATVPLKEGADITKPTPEYVFSLSAQEFFDKFNALLVDNPARPDDKPTMDRIAKLGIAPRAKFSIDGFTPDVRKAIEDGVAAGQKEVTEWHSKMGEKVNGWQLARDLGKYGTKYAYRAAWTYYAVGGNLVEDAFYPTTQVDNEGKPLTGENKYVLHFAKEELPPVDAFWSLTMYDEKSYLVDNPINRYALGGKDKMVFGDDGSLIIYIQKENPGQDKEANWLPAPTGPIFLALRLYNPRKSVADGTWNPPGVQKVQ